MPDETNQTVEDFYKSKEGNTKTDTGVSDRRMTLSEWKKYFGQTTEVSQTGEPLLTEEQARDAIQRANLARKAKTVVDFLRKKYQERQAKKQGIQQPEQIRS